MSCRRNIVSEMSCRLNVLSVTYLVGEMSCRLNVLSALFLSNHGRFQSYLYKINKSPSPFCICGKYSDSLHYILDCPLTSRFHVRKDPNVPISHWISFIIKNPNSIQRIKNCMIYVEKNDHHFQNPNPPQVHSGSSDSDSE